MNFKKRITIPISFCLIGLCFCACSVSKALWQLAHTHYPVSIYSRQDIERANRDVELVEIRSLPLEDYFLLSKFPALMRIDLYSQDNTEVTDNHLITIAELSFTNLQSLSLLNCRAVTDQGIHELSRIRSLKALQVHEAAITDAGITTICSMTNITAVFVENCKGVTFEGIKALASLDRLNNLRFSSEHLSQPDVLHIFGLIENVKWCEIVDIQRKLNESELQKVAARRGFHLLVITTATGGH